VNLEVRKQYGPPHDKPCRELAWIIRLLSSDHCTGWYCLSRMIASQYVAARLCETAAPPSGVPSSPNDGSHHQLACLPTSTNRAASSSSTLTNNAHHHHFADPLLPTFQLTSHTNHHGWFYAQRATQPTNNPSPSTYNMHGASPLDLHRGQFLFTRWAAFIRFFFLLLEQEGGESRGPVQPKATIAGSPTTPTTIPSQHRQKNNIVWVCLIGSSVVL
jgi:hypothetical protein